MARLTLKFLGPPEVTFAGEPLRFRSRKVLGLLIYLVLTGGRQPREKLVDLLWPASDARRGMSSLRNSIARLKQALAPAGAFLLAERGYVAFDFSQPFDLDVTALEAALAPEAALADQLAALARYRGDFLEGFEAPDAPDFEQWLREQRAHMARQWENLFTTVARRQLDAGDGRAALATAARLAGIMPLSEAAARLQMKAHAFHGERDAALRVFERLRRRLDDELALPPAPETAALATQLRRGAKTAKPPPAPRSSDLRSDRSTLQLPFVGRTAEFKLLQRCYVQAEQGKGHVALIVGDAGQGKTALANWFLNWAALQESLPDVIQGRAFEVGGHLPYQPLIDGIRVRLQRENAPEDLLEDVWMAELSQLLPELRSRYPDLPPPLAGAPDYVRGRLFEAMATLGLALGARRPLILHVDDLQWADAGTLDMLLYLIQRFTAESLPALLLIAVRREGIETQPDLRNWIRQLERLNALERIELESLSEHTLQQLFSQLARQHNLLSDEAKQLGRWLHRQTDGAPFFMTAMLQTLLDEELLVGERGEAGRFVPDLGATLTRLQAVDRAPLPPTVRDMVLNQLHQLTERAQTLLLAAAVIGRACTLERLGQMTDMALFDALPAVEALLAGRLMVERQDTERPLAIAHDNIRDVVYGAAGVTRRRLFHRRLLALLEEDGAPAAELAFHAAAAGLHQAHFDYAVIAGDHSLAVHAFTDAIAFYQQALPLVGRVTVTEAQQGHLCVRYGRALELAGRYQDALSHYTATRRAAREKGQRRLELAALVAQGTIYATANELSDFQLGERAGQEALELARALDDQAAEARIQWNLLNVYRMTSRDEQALEAGQRAIALGEALGLQEVTAYATNDLVYIYMSLGDVSRVLSCGDKAITLWRALGNRPMLTDSLINYANTRAMTGAFGPALEIAAEALQISQALDNLWAQSFSYYTPSLVYWRMMQVDKALAAMTRSIELSEAAGFTGAQVLVRLFQAQLLLLLGEAAGAAALVQAAAAVARESIPLFLPAARGVAALVAIRQGDLSRAEAIIAADGLAEVPFSLMNFLTPETAVCQYLLATGRHEAAHDHSRRILAHLTAQNLRLYRPDFLYFQGQALLGLRRGEAARETLTAALGLLRETGSRWYLPEVAQLLADVYEAAGDGEPAGALRREARAALQAIAEQIPVGPLRDAFLARPDLRRPGG